MVMVVILVLVFSTSDIFLVSFCVYCSDDCCSDSNVLGFLTWLTCLKMCLVSNIVNLFEVLAAARV